MKDKNLPLDNSSQSLEELTNEANTIIESLEREKDLRNSINSYQELLKLNNIIEKKFHKTTKIINEETKKKINEAITAQDIEQLKTLVHKLNGACCYSGVPNLNKVTHQIETALKKGESIEDLEPEFYEFFEHIDNVITVAPQILHSL